MFIQQINNVFFKRGNIIMLVLSAYLSSCASYKEISNNSINALRSNNVNEDLYKKLQVSDNDKNAILFNEEKGRVAFITGDRKESIASFSKALKIYNFNDEKGSIGNLGSSIASSTLASDEVLPYQGTSFERVLINLYQSLNYLSKGDLNNAMVYVRAAEDAHKLAIAKREELINKLEYEKQQATISFNAPAEVLKTEKDLKGLGKSLFLSAYVYYISGNIREIAGERAGALIDYKKAFELYQKNSFIAQDLLRLNKNYDAFSYNVLLKQVNMNLRNLDFDNYNKENSVLVIYEQGFVPTKEQTAITLVINGIVSKMAFPVYKYDQSSRRMDNKISLIDKFGNYEATTKLEEISNIYNMARNALKEEYIGIISRQTTRVLTKGASQAVLTNVSDNTGVIWFDIAGKLFGMGSALLENADTRSFSTLPEYVDVAKLNSLADISGVSIVVGGKTIKIDNLNLKGGEIAIVVVNDLGTMVYQNVIYKGKKRYNF